MNFDPPGPWQPGQVLVSVTYHASALPPGNRSLCVWQPETPGTLTQPAIPTPWNPVLLTESFAFPSIESAMQFVAITNWDLATKPRRGGGRRYDIVVSTSIGPDGKFWMKRSSGLFSADIIFGDEWEQYPPEPVNHN